MLPKADSNLSEGMLFSCSSCLALSMVDFSIFLVLLDIFLSYEMPRATKLVRDILFY